MNALPRTTILGSGSAATGHTTTRATWHEDHLVPPVLPQHGVMEGSMMTTLEHATSSDAEAFADILDHHAALCRELDDRVRTMRMVALTRAAFRRPLAALTAFLEGSVLPHAAAEEATLYPAAASDPDTALLVEAMVIEHNALTERTRALARAGSAVEAAACAEGIAAVFGLHVAKENELLLPALRRVHEGRLAALLRDMRQRLGELP